MVKLAALSAEAWAPAAPIEDCDGSTKLPAAFLSATLVKPACREYAYSTYPMAPGVWWMKAATPVLSCSPIPMLVIGHFVEAVVPAAELVHVDPPVSMRYWSRS